MDEQQEIWKLVQDFPDYEVSNLGRVRRCTPGNKNGVDLTGKMMKVRKNTTGYAVVGFCRNGKSHAKLVHHWVAEAFIGPRPPGMQINHKDSDRMNACATNLEYCTWRENYEHACNATGWVRGEKCGTSILKEDDVRRIRKMYDCGMKPTAIAKETGFKRDTVKAVVGRVNWKWLD